MNFLWTSLKIILSPRIHAADGAILEEDPDCLDPPPWIHSAEDTILTFIARYEENEKFRLLILLICNRPSCNRPSFQKLF